MFRAARWRLVAWNVSVLTLILVVLGVAAYSLISRQVYMEVDQRLRQEQSTEANLIASLGTYYALHSQGEYRITIANASGNVNMSSECPDAPLNTIEGQQCPADSFQPTSKEGLEAALAKPAAASFGDIRLDWFQGKPWRVLTFAMTPTLGMPLLVQIGREVDPEYYGLNDIKRMLIFGGIVGIILAWVGSLFLANRALVPIRLAFIRQRKFTADASHELRTPLALIRANAEMLYRSSDQLPPDDANLIDEIIHETDHLNRLVGDLLTLARADSDSVELKMGKVDLRALVAEVLEDVARIAESRGIQSELSLDGPVMVDGDETRLRQLLLILLDNALKYTDPGGKVEVSLQREDGRARLVVADTGIGIPAKDLPQIFERFYRVDRAREHESGGTGLGLAIARWIIQAHRGHVKVDSELGRGTRFQIDLPMPSAEGHFSRPSLPRLTS